jgi:hypothetical protein
MHVERAMWTRRLVPVLGCPPDPLLAQLAIKWPTERGGGSMSVIDLPEMCV